MSKFCPLINDDVLYLDCIDCDDKDICKSMLQDSKDMNNDNQNNVETKQGE